MVVAFPEARKERFISPRGSRERRRKSCGVSQPAARTGRVTIVLLFPLTRLPVLLAEQRGTYLRSWLSSR